MAYLALLPETPTGSATGLLPHVDGALLRTAAAGGGSFDDGAIDRLRAVPNGLRMTVDGDVGPDHFSALRSAGVELAAVGRTLSNGENHGVRAKEPASPPRPEGAGPRFLRRFTCACESMRARPRPFASRRARVFAICSLKLERVDPIVRPIGPVLFDPALHPFHVLPLLGGKFRSHGLHLRIHGLL
jgi:hypothetical protein